MISFHVEKGMNDMHLPSLNNRSASPHFGARQIGNVTIPTTKANTKPMALDIYRLTGTDSDIAFLDKGLDRLRQEKPGQSMVPSLPEIDRDNHFELVEEGLELSKDLLKKFRAGQLTHPPQVLLAVQKDTNELVGLELANIERTLPDQSRVYTPLKTHLATDKTTTDSPNHTSINWLFTLTPFRGVGLALSSLLQLPRSVKRVDVVSETSDYTSQAPRLYKGLGFEEVPNMENEKPIPQNPTPEHKIPTFKEIHGIPMTISREKLDSATTQIQTKLQFKPSHSETEVNLFEKVRFPSYSIQ